MITFCTRALSLHSKHKPRSTHAVVKQQVYYILSASGYFDTMAISFLRPEWRKSQQSCRVWSGDWRKLPFYTARSQQSALRHQSSKCLERVASGCQQTRVAYSRSSLHLAQSIKSVYPGLVDLASVPVALLKPFHEPSLGILHQFTWSRCTMRSTHMIYYTRALYMGLIVFSHG